MPMALVTLVGTLLDITGRKALEMRHSRPGAARCADEVY